MTIAAIWHQDRSRAEAFADQHQVPRVVDHYEAMIGTVDGVMIHEIDWSQTARLASPFLAAGVPTYVNRPFAAGLAQAREIIAAAERYGSPLTTFSTLTWLTQYEPFRAQLPELGPLQAYIATAPAASFPCYAPHAIELCYALCGGGVEAVTTHGEILPDFRPAPEGRVAFIHLQHRPDDQGLTKQGLIQLFSGCGGVNYQLQAFGRGSQACLDLSHCDFQEDLCCPSLLAVQRMFEARLPPIPYPLLLEKLRVLLAAHRSWAERRTVALQEVDDYELPFDGSYYEYVG